MKPSASPSSGPGSARAFRAAVIVAAALVLLATAGPILEKLLITSQARTIGGPDFAMSPELGKAWTVSLMPLDLAHIADSGEAPMRSRLVLTENGVPLQAHALHEDVRRNGGRFSHWGHYLYFSTNDGSDPRTNGRSYQIIYPQDRISGFSLVMSRLQAGAIAFLVALGAVGALFQGRAGSEVLKARGAMALLVGAAACALFSEVWAARDRYGVTPDSDSYTESPALGARPPAYYGLMKLVTDPAAVRAEARALAEVGKSNTVIEASGPSPIRRVVFAQRLVLWAALCFLGVALGCLIGAPWAVAVLLLVGKAQDKLADGSAWSWVVAGLFMVPITAGMWRESGWRRWRTLPLAILALVTLRPVVWVALERPLMPGQVDLLMSETLAGAFVVAMLGALALVCARRGAYWIVLAAALAGGAYLTRPAAIYCLAVVGLAALWQCGRQWRIAWRGPAAAMALMVVAAMAPGLIKKAMGVSGADISMLRWSLAAYALTVAEPGDVVHLKEADTRAMLELSLPRRDRIRTTFPIPADLAFSPEVYRLGQYMYHVVLPVSQQLAEQQFPGDRQAQVAKWNKLLGDMGLPLYRVHARELGEIFLSSYLYMLHQGTRLSRSGPFWGLLLCAAVMIGLKWSRMGALAVFCLAAHSLHLAVVCMFDQPLERYVFATEFCAVLGIWIAVVAATVAQSEAGDVP